MLTYYLVQQSNSVLPVFAHVPLKTKLTYNSLYHCADTWAWQRSSGSTLNSGVPPNDAPLRLIRLSRLPRHLADEAAGH